MQRWVFLVTFALPLVKGQCQDSESCAEDASLLQRLREAHALSEGLNSSLHDQILKDFGSARLMATKQLMSNSNFWKCITDQSCADKRPTMWFSLLHPNVPQKLLAKNGPLGLLARTDTWWDHVPTEGNLEWNDYWTCGNIGLKNPMFRSPSAFHAAILDTVKTGASHKRDCVASNNCPPFHKYSCGEIVGVKPQKTMPKERVWVEHMEVRAITGKLEKGNPGRINFDDPRIYQWQDDRMWEGEQKWPQDPFVAGFYDFMGQRKGFTPKEEALRGNDFLLLNLCCTLLMSSSSKSQYQTEMATFPLYFHWYTSLPPKGSEKEAENVGKAGFEFSFLSLARSRLRCSVTKCETAADVTKDPVYDPSNTWLPPAAANDDLARICSVGLRRRRRSGSTACRRRSGVEYLPSGCVCGTPDKVAPFPTRGGKLDVLEALSLVDKTPLVINRLQVTAVVCVKVGMFLKECKVLKPNEAYGVDQDTTFAYSLLGTPGDEVPSQLGELLGDSYTQVYMAASLVGMMTTLLGCSLPAFADGPLPIGDVISAACTSVAGMTIFPTLGAWLGLEVGTLTVSAVATQLYTLLSSGTSLMALANSFVNDVDMEGYRAETSTILNTGDKIYELRGGLFDMANGWDGSDEIGLRFDEAKSADVVSSNITNILGKDE